MAAPPLARVQYAKDMVARGSEGAHSEHVRIVSTALRQLTLDGRNGFCSSKLHNLRLQNLTLGNPSSLHVPPRATRIKVRSTVANHNDPSFPVDIEVDPERVSRP